MKAYKRFVSVKATGPIEDAEHSYMAGADMTCTLSQTAGDLVYQGCAELCAALGRELREALVDGPVSNDRLHEAVAACEAKLRVLLKLDAASKSLAQNLAPLPLGVKVPERPRPLLWAGISGAKAMSGLPIWTSKPSAPATPKPKAVAAPQATQGGTRLEAGSVVPLTDASGKAVGYLSRGTGPEIVISDASGRRCGTLDSRVGGSVTIGGRLLATIGGTK